MKPWLPIAILLLGVAVPAAAQTQFMRPRTTELTLSGSFQAFNTDGNTDSGAILDAFAGFLATSHIEIGVDTNVLKAEGADAVGGISGVFLFNFPSGARVVPYIGASVGTGFGYPDFTGNPFLLGVAGGVRVMTAGGGGAFLVQPFYQRQSFSSDFGDVDVNVYGVAFGISVFF